MTRLVSPESESSPRWLSQSRMRKAPFRFPSACSIFSASSRLVSGKYHLQTKQGVIGQNNLTINTDHMIDQMRSDGCSCGVSRACTHTHTQGICMSKDDV